MKGFIITILLTGCLLTSKAQSADQLKTDAMNAEIQENYEQAAELFVKAALAFENEGTYDGESLYGAGVNYMNIKKYNDATPFLRKSYELGFNSGKSCRLLSDAYRLSKQFSEAEQILLEGAKKLPEEKDEFNSKLAYLYFNSGQYAKSVMKLNELLSEKPNDRNYLYLKGFSLERIQRFDEAIDNFNRILEQHPDDKKAKKMLAYTFFEKVEEGYEKEVKRYNSMSNAKLADYVETKKQLKQLKDEYEESRLMLEESFNDFPTDKMLINALYKVYKKQNNTIKMAEMQKLM
ncbi:tetratricopeptide repeat protein [Sunxiuqinia indica]|uniref:tetratricopeptide repeat protein n=1 Tax=Sunxiuqinia indica TaxID=2692584 RepID=UPI001356BAAF|nr:tetratricopeptide repeat protein [Sunxiuqinia indica]